jgi:hypothetical protein
MDARRGVEADVAGGGGDDGAAGRHRVTRLARHAAGDAQWRDEHRGPRVAGLDRLHEAGHGHSRTSGQPAHVLGGLGADDRQRRVGHRCAHAAQDLGAEPAHGVHVRVAVHGADEEHAGRIRLGRHDPGGIDADG